MSDNNKTLMDSFGMPLCWIYDKQGSPIMMTDNYGSPININQMVTKFNYRFDEENDDECNITIQVVRSSQLNHPEFRTDNIILVSWGYILPHGKILPAAKRKVAIRDLKTSYESDKIELTLCCTDLVSYIRNQRENNVSDTDNFADWINEIIKGKYVYTHTIKGKVKYMNKADDRRFVSKLIQQKKDKSSTPRFEKEESVGKTRAINDQFKQTDKTKVDDGTHVIYQGKDPDRVIMGKGTALYHEAQRLLNEHPEGPGIIEGRDDRINILIRDWNQAPTAIYTFGGVYGELIDFKPRTNVQKTDDDQIENTFVNPDTKKVESTKIAHTNIDFDELPEGVSKLDALAVEAQYKMAFDYNARHLTNQINVKDQITFKRTIKSEGFANKNNVMGSTRVNTGRQFFTKIDTYSTKSILNSPFLENRRREAIMRNFMMKKVERKYEATASIIGDPSLICGKVHLIKGLSTVDNGNWYATTVDHRIDQEGYKCDVTYLRKPKLLRRLMEKREYPMGEQETSIAQYTNEAVVYEDKEPQIYSDFSVQNIDERLKAQELFDKEYLQGNDIAFTTSPFEDTTNTEPNSMNT